MEIPSCQGQSVSSAIYRGIVFGGEAEIKPSVAYSKFDDKRSQEKLVKSCSIIQFQTNIANRGNKIEKFQTDDSRKLKHLRSRLLR